MYNSTSGSHRGTPPGYVFGNDNNNDNDSKEEVT